MYDAATGRAFDGLFWMDEATGTGQPRRGCPSPAPGHAGRLVSGSWGPSADEANIVMAHSPPLGILDTLNTRAVRCLVRHPLLRKGGGEGGAIQMLAFIAYRLSF